LHGVRKLLGGTKRNDVGAHRDPPSFSEIVVVSRVTDRAGNDL
jgi:hypothetical protein